MSEYKLILPGNTPSLKNSKRVVKNKKTGQTFVIPPKTHSHWKPQAKSALLNSSFVEKQWKYPLQISAHFIRDSRRHFDYINVLQAVADLMVETGIIEDDDMDHFVPCGFSYQVNKSNPCCILTIRESDE